MTGTLTTLTTPRVCGGWPRPRLLTLSRGRSGRGADITSPGSLTILLQVMEVLQDRGELRRQEIRVLIIITMDLLEEAGWRPHPLLIMVTVLHQVTDLLEAASEEARTGQIPG